MKNCWSILLFAFFVSACSTAPILPKNTENIVLQPDSETLAVPAVTTKNQPQQIPVKQSANNNQTDTITITTAWDHIRNADNIHIDDTHPRVLKELDFFVENLEYVQILTKRSTPYIYYILQRLEAEQLPAELAVLPFIESAWLPDSTSKSGAAGLWQFMPATAKYLGIKMDALYDGRRDLIESTDKAIAYLAWLNTQFDDWLLALGAYNGGPGTISRAITKATSHDQSPPAFWDLKVSEETSEYVPKFLALLHIIKNPEIYNAELYPVKNEIAFDKIKLNRSLDIAAVSKKAGIPKKAMLDLNASYIRGITHQNKGFHLLIPANFPRDKMIALANSMPEAKYPVAKFKHKILKGQTLSGISTFYDVNIADLKLINSIKNNRIRAGDHLSIPVPVSNSGTGNQHVVKPGDTLWGIAKKYSVSMTKLAKFNSIGRNTKLMPGMVITIMGL